MKKLYVFRGLPGSGKSTLANKVAALVVEPDMFRYDENRKYVFDSSMNSEVYEKTNRLLTFTMSELGVKCIAVTATNIIIDSLKGYIAIGHNHGYDVTVVECYGDYGSVHDVPPAVVEKMSREFQPLSDETASALGVEILRVGAKSKKRWVALYVENDDTCDGMPRSLGAFKSRSQALAEIAKDIETYLNSHQDAKRSDTNPLVVVNENNDAICNWCVDEVEIPE